MSGRSDASVPDHPSAARRALLTGGAAGLAATLGTTLGRAAPANAATNPTPDWVNVKDHGAIGNGTADDTNAIKAAINALPAPAPGRAGGGVVYFPAGTYLVTKTLNLVTDPGGTPATGPMTLWGDGPSASVINFQGTGDCIRMYNGSKPSGGFGGIPNATFSGGIRSLQIDGTNPTVVTATGIHLGDGIGYYLDDVFVTNFAGTIESIGIHFDNTVFYTEKMYARCWLAGNSTNVVFDMNTGATTDGTTSLPGEPSYEYCDLTFYLMWCGGTTQGGTFFSQNGIVVQNGAYLANGSLTVRGNFDTWSSSVYDGGAALTITGWSQPVSSGPTFVSTINRMHLDIQVETDLTSNNNNGPMTVAFIPTGAIPSKQPTVNTLTDCDGTLIFSDGLWTATNGTYGQVKFGGVIIGDHNLKSINGAPSGWAQAAAPQSYTPPDPAGISASTTTNPSPNNPGMLGLGITYTPQSSGTIIVVLTGGAWSDTASDGFKITGYYGSGGPPANDDAKTGTQIGALSPAFGPLGANVIVPFTITGVVNLDPGTTYWIDLALEAFTGGTATVHKVSASVWETS